MSSRITSLGVLGLFASIAVVGISPTTQAGEITLTESFSNGTQAATVNFIFNDDGATTTLSVQLINDMTATGALGSPQWLQGVFFNISGTPTMTYTGLGGNGSDGFNDLIEVTDGGAGFDTISSWSMLGTDSITPVLADHFWGLRQDFSAGDLPFGSQTYGLAAAGLGVFSESNVLNFVTGGPVPQLDGPDGGILSGNLIDGGILDIPSGIAENHDPMLDGGLWLTFDLGSYDITSASVTDVFFQFGTSFGEVIPLPLAFPLAALGLVGIAFGRRRISKLVEA